MHDICVRANPAIIGFGFVESIGQHDDGYIFSDEDGRIAFKVLNGLKLLATPRDDQAIFSEELSERIPVIGQKVVYVTTRRPHGELRILQWALVDDIIEGARATSRGNVLSLVH